MAELTFWPKASVWSTALFAQNL